MVDNPLATKLNIPVIKAPEKPQEQVVEQPKTVEEVDKIVEELEYQQILRQYGGLESNVPWNNRYWRIRP